MFSAVVAGAFTVVFLVTGAYALVRYVRISAHRARGDGEARAVELLHLVMSIFMIAMAWGWTGGPTSASGVLQLVVFGVLGLLFGGLALGVRDLHRALSRGSHALMAVAMVWMVATMPLLMGHVDDGGSGGGHHHGAADEAASTMDTAMPPAPAPGWVVAITAVLAALLVAATGLWITRAVQAGRSPAPDRAPEAPVSTPPDGAVATLAPAAPAAAPPRPRGSLLAASCHALMSLGMAAMLLAML